MGDANQLKIEARRKEASGDYGAASELYQRALQAMERDNSLPDPSLLVRVADLEYRQSDADSALSYYHRAVEDYAEQGLITNAIAVCNKILRVFPDEIGCYRRLADLHMDVGLVAEARQNMLRYVDQAWERRETDPALEAMEELLARSPDQEIALKMATCLARLDRTDDALEVLARVWRERTKADADVEALERKARDLDPEVDLDGWLPPTEEDVEEPGMAGAESFVSDEAADESDGDAPETAEEVAGEAPDAAVSAGEAQDVAAETGAGPEAGIEADRPEEIPGDGPEDEAAVGDEEEPGEPPARSPLDELAAAAEGLAGFGSTDGEEEDRDQEDVGAPAGDGSGGGSADEASDEPWEPMSYGALDAPAGPDEEGDRTSVPAPEPETIANRLQEPREEAHELELVASFPEWFTEMAMTRPTNGSPREPAASNVERRETSAEPAASSAGRSEPNTEQIAGRTERAAASMDRAASGTEEWEERAMDELERLEELEARADVATAEDDPGAARPEGQPAGGSVGGSSGDGHGREDPAGPSAGPEARLNGSGDDLGEEKELRRGLELLDDLLEVDPDNTELKERKVRYARRLGDRETLVGAYLDLADAMAEKGSRRGARLLFEKVLELDEGNQQAEAGLGRLDRGELEQKRQTGKRAGAANATPRDPSPQEKEARRHLGMRLWTEFEKAVQEMPWLHAATQTYQATSPEAAPPVEAFEMLAHYLISRDRCREAADILEQAVKVADRSDDEIADALYYLGVAHERLGEDAKAADYFRRLDQVDPEFASVREWLPEEDRAGA